jgi:poly(3-hydroxybutyrate) depolymerase
MTSFNKPRCAGAICLSLGLLSCVDSQSSSATENADINDSVAVTFPAIQTQNISLSGLSSGAYMALQFHLSHSEIVNGSALIAGGPYYCAQNDIGTALKNCVSDDSGALTLSPLNDYYDSVLASKKVASASHNVNDKLWLFHGTKDTRIIASVADQLHAQVMTLFTPSNIKYVNDKPFAHLMPTLESGIDCNESEAPFIGACNYDAAGELLTYLGLIETARSEASSDTLKSHLNAFSQASYAGEYANTLAESGYVFVPPQCVDAKACQLHVSFHGCNQNAETVQDQYAMQSGLNEWALSNDIVVLYPQTKKSMFMPLNPQSCWDWWGYTGSEYANKEGQQIQAIMSLVERIDDIILKPL